jgi:hypothetical protein
VNALADPKVAAFVNDHFIATYLKVGTFQIIGGQKVGGNVASYFCLFDGSVLHAVAGPVDAARFLTEARWAVETRKSALTHSTKLATGEVDMKKYHAHVKKAHEERCQADGNQGLLGGKKAFLLGAPPQTAQQRQVHMLLANNPLASIDDVYPVVWEQILREKRSGLPVAQR